MTPQKAHEISGKLMHNIGEKIITTFPKVDETESGWSVMIGDWEIEHNPLPTEVDNFNVVRGTLNEKINMQFEQAVGHVVTEMVKDMVKG